MITAVKGNALPAHMPQVKRSLALMMREGMLKENIDGEALAWAHARSRTDPG